MTTLYVGTGITNNFLCRAESYLRSLNDLVARPGVCAFCICVDMSSKGISSRFERIKFYEMDSRSDPAPCSNRCVQHGSFLKHVPAREDDVVLFTDADAVFQRRVTDGDLSFFHAIGPDEVALGPLGAERDGLFDEALRIQLRIPIADLDHVLPTWRELRCFHTGAVLARGATYKQLLFEYTNRWSCVDRAFAHYAKQQWLVSYVTQARLRHVELPLGIHCGMHYGVPHGCVWADGLVVYQGGPVLIRHPA